MSQRKTVVIKGAVYDVATGALIQSAAPAHTVQKFAKHTPAQQAATADIAPTHNAVAAKAHASVVAKGQARVVKPAHVIKQEAIADAMERANNHSRKQHKVKKPTTKLGRFARFAAAGAAALVLGGYFTYINMAAISTKIAASQAGINASYPGYTPSGYQLSGPVAYTSGMVSMKFGANSAPLAYTLGQERSGWDSSAVRENYVEPKAGKNYTEAQANGLTIYTYGQNAAWVSGGILYTITGNAPLSAEQIRHIAVSL